MKKATFIALFLLYLTGVKAQTLSNINGTSAQMSDFSDVKGSPYLFNDWSKGDVTMADNSAHKNMDLKYSVLDDKLYFKKTSQSVLTFADPVKEFTFNVTDGSEPILFRDGYKNIPGVTPDSFLEVLVDGKTQLLKKLSKKVQTENVYPNTATNKFFSESKTYYLYKDGKGILIKNDKKSLLAALSDKQTELENYIKQNNLNLKEDGDLSKLITYYNNITG